MAGKYENFYEAELIFGALGTLLVDGFCALLDLTAVGLLLSPVIQGFIVFAVSRWVENKGGKITLGKELVKYAANFIPILPTTFAIFLISALIHNHPKLVQAAATVVRQKITS